jgi:hypothetical protein
MSEKKKDGEPIQGMTPEQKKAADKARKAVEKTKKAEAEDQERRDKQTAIDNDPKGVEKATAALVKAKINFDRVVRNFTNDTRFQGSIADMHHAAVMLAYYTAARNRAQVFASPKFANRKDELDIIFFQTIFEQQNAGVMAAWDNYHTVIDNWMREVENEERMNRDETKTLWAKRVAAEVTKKKEEIIADITEKSLYRLMTSEPNLNFTLGKSIYTVESTESLEKKKNELQQKLKTNPEIEKELDLIEQELEVRTKEKKARDDMNKMMMISDAAKKNVKTAQQTELQARRDLNKFIANEAPSAQIIYELNVDRLDKLLEQKKSKLDAILNEQEAKIKELEHQLLELKYDERKEIINEATLTGFDKTPGYNEETVTASDVYQHVHLNYTVPEFKLDTPAVMSGQRVTEINQEIRDLQKHLNQAQEETPEEIQAKLEYRSANLDLTLAQVKLAENKVKLARDKKEQEAAQKELEEAQINFKNAQKDQEESVFKQFLEQRGLETSPVVISSDFNRIAAIELVLRIYNELRQLRKSDDSRLKMKLKSKAIDAIEMANKYIAGAQKDHQTFMKPSIERMSIERDAFSAAMRTDRIANNALVKAEKEKPEEAKKVAAIARELEIASTDADNAESAVNLAKFNVEEAMNAFKYYEKETLRGKTYAESYQKEIVKEQDSKKKDDLLKRQKTNIKYSDENKALADKKNEDATQKERIYKEKLQLAEQANANYEEKTKKYLEALNILSPYCREKRDEANIADQKWLVAALKLMKVQRKEYEQRKLAISYTPGYQTIKERLMEKPNFVQYIHNKINTAKGKEVTREYIIELRNETQPFNDEDTGRLFLESKGKMSEVNKSELDEIADYYILDNKLQEVNQTMDDWEKEWEKAWNTKQSVDTGKMGGTRKNKKRTRKHSRKHNIKKGKKTRRHRSKRYK